MKWTFVLTFSTILIWSYTQIHLHLFDKEEHGVFISVLLCIYIFNLPSILLAYTILYLKDSRDIIEGISKLDNLLIISIFQRTTLKSNSGSHERTSSENTEKRYRRDIDHEAFVDRLVKDNTIDFHSRASLLQGRQDDNSEMYFDYHNSVQVEFESMEFHKQDSLAIKRSSSTNLFGTGKKVRLSVAYPRNSIDETPEIKRESNFMSLQTPTIKEENYGSSSSSFKPIK